MSVLHAIIEELRDDPAALEELRGLLALESAPAGPAAYTVRSLALELSLSERSVRAAIGRGELAAVKRGRGWVISADAVQAWAASGPRGQRTRASRPRRRRGVLAGALEQGAVRAEHRTTYKTAPRAGTPGP